MTVAFAVTLLGACSDNGPRTIKSIVVAPTTTTLAAGGTQQFTMTGTDNDGNTVTNLKPVWAVVAGGGTITQTGLFTAGTTAGTFTNTVSVTCSGHTQLATVVITPGPLATITVTPNPGTMAVNATQQYTAVGKDANGNVVAITPAWSVVAGGGTINAASGLFTAGGTPGTYTNTVKATSGTLSGTATAIVTPGPLATITVTPNPANVPVNATQQFTAVGKDAAGNVVAITPVWTVVNGGGAINSGSGLFTAGGTAGSFPNTVVATSGSISGNATVNVTSGVLATITVTPNPATVQVNTTQQFTAVGRDAGGGVIPITPVWSVTNGGGTIDASTGLFTAGGTAGTFSNTVRATSGAIFGTATVIVTTTPPPPPPAGVSLGSAAADGILAGTAITCITGGIINADIGISPGSNVTGFGPCVVTGTQHIADAVAAQAQADLTTAYNQLAALPCPPANAIVADLGGTTKPAGVYCTASGIGVTGTLTLDGGGDPNAVFVFQAGTSLTTAGNVVLINGAQAKNVYWQVGTSATIGTASQWQGNILALTSITLVDNANLIGRALARNGAVTLGTNNVITLP
ncbi:MAG: ice-binding family protein [Gemmatimonadaceae bacterium]